MPLCSMCPGSGLRNFEFDRVFDYKVDNRSVYAESMDSIVAGFLNGKSAAVFACALAETR